MAFVNFGKCFNRTSHKEVMLNQIRSLEYNRISYLSAIVDLQEPAPLRATAQVNSSQGLARSNGGFD